MNPYTTISGGGFVAPSPTFDPKGNTLTLPRSNGTSQTLTWDAHDRLRSVTPSGSTASTMVYDPLGRLVWSRRPNGANPAINEVWSWSSWTLLAREIYQASTLLETYRYTWGPDLSGTLEGAGGVGGLLAVERAVGSSTTWDIRHTHADANGNILALTTSTGQVSARYRYSPFGETLSSQDLDSSGWATKNIHRYSTKPEIAGTSLLYYGYRYYDPQTGRWPSRDPIEERGGLNLYGFVENNFPNLWDILGERQPPQGNCPAGKIKDAAGMNTCGTLHNVATKAASDLAKMGGTLVLIGVGKCIAEKWYDPKGQIICDAIAVPLLVAINKKYNADIAKAATDYQTCVNGVSCVCP